MAILIQQLVFLLVMVMLILTTIVFSVTDEDFISILLSTFVISIICYCFVIVLQVLVWKTNFDQLDFSEVLQSHKNRQEETTPSEPTVNDIPPRVTRKPAKPKSPRGVSISSTCWLQLVSCFKPLYSWKKLMHVLPYNLYIVIVHIHLWY